MNKGLDRLTSIIYGVNMLGAWIGATMFSLGLWLLGIGTVLAGFGVIGSPNEIGLAKPTVGLLLGGLTLWLVGTLTVMVMRDD